MTDNIYKPYPIRNKYEYFLPQAFIFNSDNIGRYELNDLHIYTEPSYYDGHSEDHRFNTFHCNSITDHDQAWVVGVELVSILRGLVTIFYGENYQKDVYLEKMIVKDDTINYPNYKMNNDVRISSDLYQVLGKSYIIKNLTFSERKIYRENAKSNVFSSSFYLAQSNLELYFILKYFSEPLTWVSLYKIMETFMTIEKNYEIDWKIPYDEKDKTRFTNPANNFSLIGIDARHGLKKDSLKINNRSKMDLQEAKEMFIACAKSYLEFKLQQLRTKL